MKANFKKAEDILTKYHQEHLLQFYDELSNEQQEYLVNQILSINFDEIINLYEKSKLTSTISTEYIEPISYYDKLNFTPNDIYIYNSIGQNCIKDGKIAVVTLAGGQGSRLGYKGPKGTFKLETSPSMSLFEILCNYLKRANNKFHCTVPWYIMTSTENHIATKEFFEQNNYFNYGKENITFFVQDNLPLIDKNGNLILEETYKIKQASNGNGNLFYSLKKNYILNDMIFKKLKWIFIGGIDNVLLDPLDPFFIGLSEKVGNPIASKTLFKDQEDSLDWVFAVKNGKPAIVDCENFVSELSKIKDKYGNYLYRETNMLAHLFNIDALKYMSNVCIPYHRAFRKCPFVNEEGMKQVPELPNVYKFEQFVFDAFSHFDNITLLQVEAEKEFAPIKDFSGPHNPEVAKEMYEKNVLHSENSLDVNIYSL